MTALIAAGAGLLGAIVGAGVSLGVAAYNQRHQDRREKRQRVHASFQRVLMAAKHFAAMTAPLQRAGGGAWGEPDMAEEDRRRFQETLERLIEGLQNAVVGLTLEGITEPVDAVEELAAKFEDFRWHHQRTRGPRATEDDWRVPAEASQAIAAISQQLESQLRATLDEILPVRRAWGPRGRRSPRRP
jgi:hypothetical protein